jgi:DNA-3-methyladenine glycosylase II
MDYPMLDAASLQQGTRALAGRDAALGELVARNGVPPLWARPRGFATLVQLILEQQVSLASAAAVYRKLRGRIARVTPAAFLQLDDAALQACGFSRQKMRYCRLLAEGLVARRWRLGHVHRAPAASAREMLMAQTGIGAWTADVYLLMALRHPDVWPPGDVALIRQFEETMPVRRIDSRRAQSIIRSWRPWRSVAARILWHEYLRARGRL